MTRLKAKCPICTGSGFETIFDRFIEDWIESDCNECGGAGWLDGTYFDIIDLQHGEQDEE